ncbi:hypothetical protein K438DRAFT_1770023 [Mycena galopus ATCC 62051]|nr:hypothetical protein K438DRAFT_1770023 [Mycena galopus ATCC 62051]
MSYRPRVFRRMENWSSTRCGPIRDRAAVVPPNISWWGKNSPSAHCASLYARAAVVPRRVARWATRFRALIARAYTRSRGRRTAKHSLGHKVVERSLRGPIRDRAAVEPSCASMGEKIERAGLFAIARPSSPHALGWAESSAPVRGPLRERAAFVPSCTRMGQAYAR